MPIQQTNQKRPFRPSSERPRTEKPARAFSERFSGAKRMQSRRETRAALGEPLICASFRKAGSWGVILEVEDCAPWGSCLASGGRRELDGENPFSGGEAYALPSDTHHSLSLPAVTEQQSYSMGGLGSGHIRVVCVYAGQCVAVHPRIHREG